MNENVYQAMPKAGKLARNVNLNPESLLEQLAQYKESTVYSYVVDTVEYGGP